MWKPRLQEITQLSRAPEVSLALGPWFQLCFMTDWMGQLPVSEPPRIVGGVGRERNSYKRYTELGLRIWKDRRKRGTPVISKKIVGDNERRENGK